MRAVPDATLLDVKEGKVTLEEFVASLDTGVLLRLVTGIANETPHPVENRMKKKVSFTKAPTSSGQTTGQYVETLGIPNSYMTDGPAGLHIIGFPTAGWPVSVRRFLSAACSSPAGRRCRAGCTARPPR